MRSRSVFGCGVLMVLASVAAAQTPSESILKEQMPMRWLVHSVVPTASPVVAFFALLVLAAAPAEAQQTTPAAAKAPLPGKGPAQHPFLYAGEWDTRKPQEQSINTQTANRLANGNTVICNWCAGDDNASHWPGTVQVFEVTPDKRVVWALSSWKGPDLGPSTSIQLLDEPGPPEEQQR